MQTGRWARGGIGHTLNNDEAFRPCDETEMAPVNNLGSAGHCMLSGASCDRQQHVTQVYFTIQQSEVTDPAHRKQGARLTDLKSWQF